jgi:phosphopantothenoylcysteine decarboxylase / phosphopantothenate---cysteine ligase
MRIILGVTGCIAAYKAAELLRLLQKRDFEVVVVMTRNAQRFITPMTMAALSRHRVVTDLYPQARGQAETATDIEHIQFANSADLLLVAPATANVLAKFAAGLADDFLSTLFLATTAPVVVAPAMNVNMWNHPTVQENVRSLQSRGVHVVEPHEGYLAEGIDGKGRLANLETIVGTVVDIIQSSQDLKDETVVVTAGPTCEDIDPVRYISNRSSGKMGYQLATVSQLRGAKTILISGPSRLEPPLNVEFVSVRSTDEMRERVLSYWPQCDILIKAAAVADFRPREFSSQKIKKGAQGRCLELVPTPDILSELGRQKQNQILVGFAAETEEILENALKKLKGKNLDILVVNDVTEPGVGFDSDTNAVTILTSDGRQVHVGKRSKREVADQILNYVIELKNKGKRGHRL